MEAASQEAQSSYVNVNSSMQRWSLQRSGVANGVSLCVSIISEMKKYMFWGPESWDWKLKSWLYQLYSLSHVQLFPVLWTAACQAFLSFTFSLHLLKLMSIESVMPSNHLILCHSLLLLPSIFASIRVFFQWVSSFTSSGQSIGASTSAPVLPMNIHGWLPLGLTGLISLQSKELSRVFSNTTVWKH